MYQSPTFFPRLAGFELVLDELGIRQLVPELGPTSHGHGRDVGSFNTGLMVVAAHPLAAAMLVELADLVGFRVLEVELDVVGRVPVAEAVGGGRECGVGCGLVLAVEFTGIPPSLIVPAELEGSSSVRVRFS